MRFKYLFHGTSSRYRAEIERHGLVPVNAKVYLTTHPAIALSEAENTVWGEPHLVHGYKRGVGGKPIIIRIPRCKVRNLRLDAPGYYDRESVKIRRLVPKRYAFTTDTQIAPEHLLFVESELDVECKRRLAEIHAMARLLPFQYAPAVEATILGERRRET